MLQPLGLKVLLEPGRFISGNAGILVTRVEYVKRTGKKYFAIVDAAMNDLLRPAFYESYHEIVPVKQSKARPVNTDVVGGICETGDTFCKDRPIPRVAEGDLVAILSAGAYGFVMAGTYNTRPLPAEVLVKGKKTRYRSQTPKIKRDLGGRNRCPVAEVNYFAAVLVGPLSFSYSALSASTRFCSAKTVAASLPAASVDVLAVVDWSATVLAKAATRAW